MKPRPKMFASTVHKSLYGKKKNKRCGVLDSFCSPRASLVWPVENQGGMLTSTAAEQLPQLYMKAQAHLAGRGKRRSLVLHKLRAEHKALELQQLDPSFGHV